MLTSTPVTPAKRAFTACFREEINVPLQVLSGTIPTDLHGHVYLNSPCGTVNNPTPFPKYLPDGNLNGEWGDSLFNGDAMLFRFDLDQPGQVSVKSAILKTPCYWADEATKYGTDYYKDGMAFHSLGIARSSMRIGTRNQINTAVSPFRFGPDQPTRLTANFDVGRPFEFDPVSLTLKTPVGYSSEWRGEFPVLLDADVSPRPGVGPPLLRSPNAGILYGFVRERCCESHLLPQFLQQPAGHARVCDQRISEIRKLVGKTAHER